MQNRIDSKNSLGIKEFFTRSALAKELKTFNENQIKEIENLEPDKSNTSEVLEFSQFLYEDYKFNNLILSDEKIRKEFSFAMAQCWLFTRVFLQEQRSTEIMCINYGVNRPQQDLFCGGLLNTLDGFGVNNVVRQYSL